MTTKLNVTGMDLSFLLYWCLNSPFHYYFQTVWENKKYWKWREFTLSFKKEKTLSYKFAYRHCFWVSELNKPSEHSVKRIHLNGQECLSVMGRKCTEGIKESSVQTWSIYTTRQHQEKNLQLHLLLFIIAPLSIVIDCYWQNSSR